MATINIDRVLAGHPFYIDDSATGLLDVLRTILSEPPFSNIKIEPHLARLTVVPSAGMFVAKYWRVGQSEPPDQPARAGRFDVAVAYFVNGGILPPALASLYVTPLKLDTVQRVRAEIIDPEFTEQFRLLIVALNAFYKPEMEQERSASATMQAANLIARHSARESNPPGPRKWAATAFVEDRYLDNLTAKQIFETYASEIYHLRAQVDKKPIEMHQVRKFVDETIHNLQGRIRRAKKKLEAS